MKKMIAFLLMVMLMTGCAYACEPWPTAYVVNCEEWVSLRAEPDTASERLAKVPLGAAVNVDPTNGPGKFSFCLYNDMGGYILTEYLALPASEDAEAPAASDVPGALGTLVPNVNEYLSLRKSAYEGSSLIERVYPGTPMTVLGWDGAFARVQVSGTNSVGYVHSGYVRDPQGDMSRWPYDYDYMMEDLTAMGLETEIVARSLDGRAIPVVRIGSGDTHVLIQAGIHGRELMSGRLVVDMLAQFAKDHPEGIEGVTFHVMPMVNPDGVTIAVHGAEGLAETGLREQVKSFLAREGTSHSRWKANARGTDLNRNYPTEWEALTGRTPGSNRYRGEAPLSEPESVALAEYFRRYDFACTLSYHSMGSLIYWQGAKGELHQINETLARVIGDHTGYPLEENEMGAVERGGFKDWALMDCGVPSITVEIGALDSTGSITEYTGILLRHSGSWEKIADWALAH